MSKLIFSTEYLPAGTDDRTRLARWDETMRSVLAGFDYSFGNDGPIRIHYEHLTLGATDLARFDGSIRATARRASDIAADGRDRILLAFNRGGAARISQRRREAICRTETPLLFSIGLPYEFRVEESCSWDGVTIARDRLAELVSCPEDLLLEHLDPASEAMRHLRRYIAWLNEPATVLDDPALRAHVDRTLVDLVALALGAGREEAELARTRGLRSARVQAILGEIKVGFDDPAFSPHTIAQRLGVTTRYVQELLTEAGSSFTDRVIELRLQKARAMLADRTNDRLRVTEIALTCGFNEVSYFNRCFRRRFGASPSEYRHTERS